MRGEGQIDTNRHAMPRHVAIIMDGNGRWAEARGLPRTKGHRKGVEAVKKVATAARDMGIEYLTLFSFSSENWSRPRAEIDELFSLLRMFIRRDLAELHQNNVRVVVIGSRHGVPDHVLKLLNEAQQLTSGNTGQTLVIAFNYGAHDEIARAVSKIAQAACNGEIKVDEISSDMISAHLDTKGIPDPDVIIRTSGEKRLSNFLLWQAAYSEFVFVESLWPDFDEQQFKLAICEYQNRTRRFGGIAEKITG